MTEMSIAELREAVKRMKQWFVDEEERKRNEVRLRQMKVHFFPIAQNAFTVYSFSFILLVFDLLLSDF